MKRALLSLTALAGILLLSQLAWAAAPVLNFSDIVSGPKTGLGDGLGSGAIVTIWGNNLGSSQGTSHIYIKDSAGTSREAAYVYYWANANGTHGPSDLYTSHMMQEIAVSIPSASADGAGSIYVSVGGALSNELPFYIRSTGTIYHVKTTGNDSWAGSWSSPWHTVDRATNSLTVLHAGDIVYVGNGIAANSGITYGGAGGSISGSQNNEISIVTYPNAVVTATSIDNYWTQNNYFNVSKFFVTTTDSGISSSKGGRVVGNKITGPSADGSGGAIYADCTSGATHCSAFSMFVYGNYIYNFGGAGTSNQHHTTYFSIRGPVAGGQLTGPGSDVGWNRLEDNNARFGLHFYDETGNMSQGYIAGSYTTPYLVHDNWIRNQGGACLNFGTNKYVNGMPLVTGTFNVYNNMLINCGLTINKGVASDSNAIHLYGTLNHMNINMYNNTLYGYGDIPDSVAINIDNDWAGTFAGTWQWKNNIVVDTGNYAYTSSSFVNPIASSNNLWYNGGDSYPASPPSWDTNPIVNDPMFVNAVVGNYQLQSTSPSIKAGTSTVNTVVKRDLYGGLRSNPPDIGAIGYGTVIAPMPPVLHFVQ